MHTTPLALPAGAHLCGWEAAQGPTQSCGRHSLAHWAAQHGRYC